MPIEGYVYDYKIIARMDVAAFEYHLDGQFMDGAGVALSKR